MARSGACPAVLAAKGRGELEAWREYLDNRRKKPKFAAYRHREVREALERLFHRKCAYCESFIGHVASTDVEHWRPKGRIVLADGQIVAGYWWLAAEWTNLFPACPHCNRPTKHDLPGGGKTAGKGMRFPLSPPLTAAPSEGDEVHEQPMLLNPSDPAPDRFPERHLVFGDELKDDGLLRPADDGSGGEDPLGRASIDTYGLNRADLVARRKALATQIRSALATLEDAILNLDSHQKGSAGWKREWRMILAQHNLLSGWRSESAEYLLLVRQLAEPALEALKARVAPVTVSGGSARGRARARRGTDRPGSRRGGA